MKTFRKLYYKFVILFCIISMFTLLFNSENISIFAGSFCILTGLLSFGSWAVGKEEINPDKPIRNIFTLLLWSLLGFGIMSIGISFLLNDTDNNSLTVMFLVLVGFGLIIYYIISIIKNKDVYAIISILLFIATCVVGGLSGGMLILQILTLILLASALVCLVLSMFVFPQDD